MPPSVHWQSRPWTLEDCADADGFGAAPLPVGRMRRAAKSIRIDAGAEWQQRLQARSMRGRGAGVVDARAQARRSRPVSAGRSEEAVLEAAAGGVPGDGSGRGRVAGGE